MVLDFTGKEFITEKTPEKNKDNFNLGLQKALEIIEKCKIHTAGNLILIEKKDFIEKLNQEKEK